MSLFYSVNHVCVNGRNSDRPYLGICVQVEKGFKGNSFPLIIADDAICQELRALESELEQETTLTDTISEDYSTPNSREDILHFLNELGWLFQKKSSSSLLVEFSTTRFRFLLAFSVEHDWPALVKTLLDMLVERSSMGDELVQESLEILLEIHLLAKAVKRGCRNMVNLLLNYSVEVDSSNGSKIYLFPPNSSGPGGVTPLHLAACMQNSADMVDALTNDPQEVRQILFCLPVAHIFHNLYVDLNSFPRVMCITLQSS